MSWHSTNLLASPLLCSHRICIEMCNQCRRASTSHSRPKPPKDILKKKIWILLSFLLQFNSSINAQGKGRTYNASCVICCQYMSNPFPLLSFFVANRYHNLTHWRDSIHLILDSFHYRFIIFVECKIIFLALHYLRKRKEEDTGCVSFLSV